MAPEPCASLPTAPINYLMDNPFMDNTFIMDNTFPTTTSSTTPSSTTPSHHSTIYLSRQVPSSSQKNNQPSILQSFPQSKAVPIPREAAPSKCFQELHNKIMSKIYRKNHFRILDQKAGAHTTEGYQLRTLSWLMVPVMANAILGAKDADMLFAPINFNFGCLSSSAVISAVRNILTQDGLDFTIDSTVGAIEGNTLYFHADFQTLVLSKLETDAPDIYTKLMQWVHDKFHSELSVMGQKHFQSVSHSIFNNSYKFNMQPHDILYLHLNRGSSASTSFLMNPILANVFLGEKGASKIYPALPDQTSDVPFSIPNLLHLVTAILKDVSFPYEANIVVSTAERYLTFQDSFVAELMSRIQNRCPLLHTQISSWIAEGYRHPVTPMLQIYDQPHNIVIDDNPDPCHHQNEGNPCHHQSEGNPAPQAMRKDPDPALKRKQCEGDPSCISQNMVSCKRKNVERRITQLQMSYKRYTNTVIEDSLQADRPQSISSFMFSCVLGN